MTVTEAAAVQSQIRRNRHFTSRHAEPGIHIFHYAKGHIGSDWKRIDPGNGGV